jgi:hypothetical protein
MTERTPITTPALPGGLPFDATQIQFTPAGAGAVALPVQDKLRQYPRSNTEFASLQAVVDSFGNTAANSAGGIRLPLGTYNQGSTVTFNGQNGFYIEGSGKFLTTIQATAGAAGLPLLYFDRGAYCTVKRMSINALSSGSQIGSAIECKMTANAGPTPIGMIFEDLYIDSQQTSGFLVGIRYDCAIGQDNNNEQGFFKNVDYRKCGTGLSIENYNSLWHRIFGGSSIGCGVGISTAVGLGGSFSAEGFVCTSNSVTDFDIGDNSTHSIDILECRSEGGTGAWIRCLQTGTITHGAITGTFVLGETVTQAVSGATGKFVKETAGVMTLYNVVGTLNAVNVLTGGTSGATTTATGTLTVNRTDINATNSTFHGAGTNGTLLDYRSAGKVVLQGNQIQGSGAGRKLSFTNSASVAVLIGNFMDIDSIESAGSVFIYPGNKYASAAPALVSLGGTGKFYDLSKGSIALGASVVAVSAPADATEDQLASVTVPAYLLGLNAILRITTNWSFTNNANNKTLRVRFGGAAGTAYLQIAETTTQYVRAETTIGNAGATNSQRGQSIFFRQAAGTFAFQSATQITSAVDTTANQTVYISGQKATAGDALTLESYSVELLYV